MKLPRESYNKFLGLISKMDQAEANMYKTFENMDDEKFALFCYEMLTVDEHVLYDILIEKRKDLIMSLFFNFLCKELTNRFQNAEIIDE